MSPKAKTTEYTEILVKECAGCAQPFRTRHEDATVCGAFLCIARTTWTDERWASHLRMAEARVAASVPLNELDFDAFTRFGKEIPW